MVSAPTPGSRAAEEAARQFIRLRVKDKTLDMMPDLEMKERFVVRTSTGLPIEGFLPAESQREFGEDTLFVLWWVARRQNGERNLPFAQAEREWPRDLGPDDIDITLVDLDDEPEADDSPESEGPAMSVTGPTSPTSSESAPGNTNGSLVESSQRS